MDVTSIDREAARIAAFNVLVGDTTHRCADELADRVGDAAARASHGDAQLLSEVAFACIVGGRQSPEQIAEAVARSL